MSSIAVFSFSKILLGNLINDLLGDEAAAIAATVILIVIMWTIMPPLIDLLANWLREVLAQRMEKEVRDELFLNLLGKSQSFHDEQRLGDIMARATNDVRQINFLISPALTLIIQAFLSVLIPILMIWLIPEYPPQLIIFPLIFNILFIIVVRRYVKTFGPVTSQNQVEYGNLNSILNESLSGIEVIKGMAQEKQTLKKYRNQAKKNMDLGIKEGRIQAFFVAGFMVAVTMVLCFGHATLLIKNGEFAPGRLVGYMVLINEFFFPSSISVWAFGIYSRATAGAKRITEIMNQTSEIGQIEDPIKRDIKGKIEFKSVSFHYPRTKNIVLKDISFQVESGQTVAIVGTTGSGKTTCTKLISRLYDIPEGEILIDGIDIKNYSLKNLRNQIAYIEQDIFLFSKSIYENIAFGRKTSMEEVINAAKDAQAHKFISNTPNGYESEVGERGVQLSGGERQRIAIARAFISNPKILVLDDSTSAIDSATEEEIQKAISRILKGRTTFLITHRLSQIRWADKIIVFHQGKISAQGTHFDLLKESEEYRNIFLTRFDKSLEELLEVEQ